MTVNIVTQDMRAEEETNPTILILGLPGSGKTFLSTTLPAEETLFIDVEGGDASIIGEEVGLTMRPNELYKGSENPAFSKQTTWENMRDIAVALCGATNDSGGKTKYKVDKYAPYSPEHYNAVVKEWGDKKVKALQDKIKYIYVDSMTKASALCKDGYADAHPTSVTKHGAFDGISSFGTAKSELEMFSDLFKANRNITFVLSAQILSTIEKIGTNPVVEITKYGVDAAGSYKRYLQRFPDVVLLLEVSKNRVDENGVPLRQLRTAGVSKDLPSLMLKKRMKLNETEPADLTLLIKKLTSKKVKEVKKVEEKGEK